MPGTSGLGRWDLVMQDGWYCDIEVFLGLDTEFLAGCILLRDDVVNLGIRGVGGGRIRPGQSVMEGYHIFVSPRACHLSGIPAFQLVFFQY